MHMRRGPLARPSAHIANGDEGDRAYAACAGVGGWGSKRRVGADGSPARLL